jgi:hypothetical protein
MPRDDIHKTGVEGSFEEEKADREKMEKSDDFG